LIDHPELHDLNIAHIDCDAFYASVEKRDRPELKDKPVIVGGGRRGVVSAACYVARVYGVHSAMPMFKALKLCPDAVVLRPDMAKYQTVGRRIREMMQEVTPLVEPLSIDEAFLDLSGTAQLHGGSPATTLARLAKRIESELDLTVSIGLSYNKFLAKIASDLDKPRGFAVLGRADADRFLVDKPVGIIWGVGKALRRALERDGIRTLRDLRKHEEIALQARYGVIGKRLYRFARGQDSRQVEPNAPVKSISAETTFNDDIDQAKILLREIWPLCEKVAKRLSRANLAGRCVTLKLKTNDFKLLTRSRRLSDPTRLAERLYRNVKPLIEREADGRRFRLIGVGASELVDGALADPPDLLDPDRERQAKVEKAIEAVRAKLGDTAIRKGRGL
jgi:DNA polymerase-4